MLPLPWTSSKKIKRPNTHPRKEMMRRQTALECLERRDQPAGVDSGALPTVCVSEPPAIISQMTQDKEIALAASDRFQSSQAEGEDTRKSIIPGFMLVGLGRWSQDSVENFIEVLTEKGSPNTVAFSFASIIDGVNELTEPAYNHAVTILGSLATANKRVTVTIYMGIHRTGGEDGEGSLETQANQFSKFLDRQTTVRGINTMVRDLPRISFQLSPSLEDEYEDGVFENQVRQLARKLKPADLNEVAKFVRSSTHAGDLTSTSQKLELESDSFEGSRVRKTKEVVREYHGPLESAKPFQIYSNDGQFVYSSGNLDGSTRHDENEKSGHNADTNRVTDPFHGIELSLDAFLSESKDYIQWRSAQTTTLLFWRAAYNLFPLKESDAAEYVYDMDRDAGNALKDRVDGFDSPDGKQRGAHFNILEQQVARKILGTYRVDAPMQLEVRGRPGTKSVRLQWKAGDNTESISEYTIEIGKVNTDGSIQWNFLAPKKVRAIVTQATMTGLSPGTQYAFRVFGSKGRNATYSTNTVLAATRETQALETWSIASSDLLPRSAVLTWDSPGAEETGFRIQLRTGGSETWVSIGEVSASTTRFEVGGLNPNTSYQMRVQALIEADETLDSAVLALTTPSEIPSAPQNLLASNLQTNSLDLRWEDRSNNEDQFVVYISRDGGANWESREVVGANITSCTLNQLATGTRYLIKVQAANASGFSFDSNIQDVTTLDVVPNAPGNLRVLGVTSRTVTLQWDDNSANETAFRVAVSRDGGSSWGNVGVTGANETLFSAGGLDQGTHYLFKVRAANAVGYSEYTRTVEVWTLVEPPVAPANLRVENLWARTIDLRWDDRSDNEQGFRIAMSMDGVSWTNVGETNVNQVTFRMLNLQPGTRYFFKVRAANTAGFSEYTNTLEVTTRLEPPNAPGNLRATNVWARTVDLAWDDLSVHETEFRIAISRDGGATWDNLGTVGANVRTFRAENLAPNTRYLFKVRAGNSAGFSDYSNVLSLTTRRS